MNWTNSEDKVLKTHFPSSPKDTIYKLLPNRSWAGIQKRARDSLGLRRNPQNRIIKRVSVDTKIREINLKELRRNFGQEKKQWINEIKDLRKQLEEIKLIPDLSTYHIPYREPKTRSESTAVCIWSDWHIEEEV